MDYDIIKKLFELTHTDAGFSGKLDEAARVFLEGFCFDQCLIYVFVPEGEAGRFVLRAVAGRGGVEVESYGGGEGLPGAARESKAMVEARVTAPEEWRDAGDPGLEGVERAIVLPLKGGRAVHGAVYLKAFGPAAGSPPGSGEPALLELAAMELTNMLVVSALVDAGTGLKKDLAEIQKRLADAEKLMVLGDMAATLAHEIRNPLVSIGGFAARVKKKISPDSPVRVYVENLVEEVEKVERVMDGVVRFLKDNSVALELDDMNAIVEEAVRIFAPDFEENDIEVVKVLSAGPLPVMGDREQLKIAFDNIISNAIQSITKSGKRGTLRLATSVVEDYVEVEFTDTGGGIDPEAARYIFNPFFTTKTGGTGLGLAISNSIISRHKGVIDVTNDYGTGVTFSIRLPGADKNERDA